MRLSYEQVLLAVETTLVVDLVEAAKDAVEATEATDKGKAAEARSLIEQVNGIVDKVDKALDDNRGLSNTGDYKAKSDKRRARHSSLIILENTGLPAIKRLVHPVAWYARFARSQQIHATLLTTDQPRPLPAFRSLRVLYGNVLFVRAGNSREHGLAIVLKRSGASPPWPRL